MGPECPPERLTGVWIDAVYVGAVSEHLRLEIDGALAVLTIDRPDKRNAMSFEMWSAVPSLIAKVSTDDGVRVLIIRGTDHFSAGADIAEFGTLRGDASGARRYSG